jgi:fructosamine-3-kinase
MEATRTLRVPAVLYTGAAGDGAFLLLEQLDFVGGVDGGKFGSLLAQLHSAPTSVNCFGFNMDNMIGGTPQLNTWSTRGGTAGWVDFFGQCRLAPQLRLTRDAEAQRLGERLMSRLPTFFDDLPEIMPSLIHGDLWSGNVGSVEGGCPAVWDPASYYGHAEAEFGMSWCATCFTPAFWAAYHAVRPRSVGWERRQRLYRLYHVLNHWSLFGSGYRDESLSLLTNLAGE